VIETFERLERINHRMHNKLMVVDNRATILGGRNIGNEYFGLSPTFNFRDLDVLGVGPVARQASGVFDRFWNSHWVMEVAVLGIQAPPGALQGHEESLEARLTGTSDLALFLQEPDDPEERFMALPSRLHLGSSRVHTDTPDADAVSHHLPEAIRALIGAAQDEVLITNAYVIPD
jgi:putative cardiolipin synthase